MGTPKLCEGGRGQVENLKWLSGEVEETKTAEEHMQPTLRGGSKAMFRRDIQKVACKGGGKITEFTKTNIFSQKTGLICKIILH